MKRVKEILPVFIVYTTLHYINVSAYNTTSSETYYVPVITALRNLNNEESPHSKKPG